MDKFVQPVVQEISTEILIEAPEQLSCGVNGDSCRVGNEGSTWKCERLRILLYDGRLPADDVYPIEVADLEGPSTKTSESDVDMHRIVTSIRV